MYVVIYEKDYLPLYNFTHYHKKWQINLTLENYRNGSQIMCILRLLTLKCGELWLIFFHERDLRLRIIGILIEFGHSPFCF